MVGRRFHVQTIGGFRLTNPEGCDVTPKPARSRALLALLCLTESRRRPRRWIEGMLWSQRGAEQAHGSLRQALTAIRKSLGRDHDLLLSDREDIALEPGAFRVDLVEDPAAAARGLRAGREFLEGLIVSDPEFERWLRGKRRELGAAGAPVREAAEPADLRLVLAPSVDGTRTENLLALSMAERISRLIHEFAQVDVVAPGAARAQVGPAEHGLRVGVDVVADGGSTHFLVRLEATDSGYVLWSNHLGLAAAPGAAIIADRRFDRLANQAAETAVDLIPKLFTQGGSDIRAEAYVARALREMFSFDSARLRVADGLLGEAAQLAPSARLDAWRSLLRMFMIVERTERDIAGLRGEAEAFSRSAMEGAEGNALILGIIAKVKVLLDGDADAGGYIARDAAERNPGNPFVLSGLASALMHAGRPREALEVAERGSSIGRTSLFSHWLEMPYCLAHVAVGDYDRAIASAEAIHARMPTFRPPLRHLYALYTQRGDVARAQDMAIKIRRLEPDFSLRMIRENPAYPAGVLRSTPLIGLDDIAI